MEPQFLSPDELLVIVFTILLYLAMALLVGGAIYLFLRFLTRHERRKEEARQTEFMTILHDIRQANERTNELLEKMLAQTH